jgi:hypothetical protein
MWSSSAWGLMQPREAEGGRREGAEIEAGAAGMGFEPGNFCPLAAPVSKLWADSIRLQSAYFGAFDAFYRTLLQASILGLSSFLKVEPTVGIEPTTGGLQNRCSTAELCWHSEGLR